jgi:type IV pilus assembly protein PilV
MNIHRRNGFTLIEVLVALVVLSIGLLGIGKLVMVSSRANDSAYMRSQATALAYTILDNMRANQADATANGFLYNVGTGAYANPGFACSNASPCTVQGQLAQYDLWQWKSALLATLPAGDGTVTTVASADPITGNTIYLATITVQWNDTVASQSLGGVAAPNMTVTLESQL